MRYREAQVSYDRLDPTPSFRFTIGRIHLPDGSTKLLVPGIVFGIYPVVIAVAPWM